MGKTIQLKLEYLSMLIFAKELENYIGWKKEKRNFIGLSFMVMMTYFCQISDIKKSC